MAKSDEKTTTNRNVVQTPLNPSCRICHYAGYSNVCTFFEGGECPIIAMRKSLAAATMEN